jgi:6-phosphogluconolactonase
MFRFDEGSERLSLVHVEWSRGRVPREFTQWPEGRYLLVANQETDTIVTFEIDEDKPGLDYVSETEVPTPVSLLFP